MDTYMNSNDFYVFYAKKEQISVEIMPALHYNKDAERTGKCFFPDSKYKQKLIP